MIRYEQEYIEYLKKVSVGKNDRVASSVKSYVSYLSSVSRILNLDIYPSKVANEDDIGEFYRRFRRKKG